MITIKNPLLCRLSGHRVQLRCTATVHPGPGSVHFFAIGRPLKVTFWGPKDILPDFHGERLVTIVRARHVPGSDRFLELP